MKKVGIAFLIVTVVVSTASATIVNDTGPSWRGDDNTTYQAWGFDNDNNPADLDIDLNPYGDPTAEVIGVDPPYGPPDFVAPNTYWKDTDNGHQGLWRIYGDSSLRLYLPNNPVTNDYKEIWLQLTYYASGETGAMPEFFVFPENAALNLISKIQVDEHYYYHAIWQIIIEPNPDEEWVTLQPRDCTLYIDEVVVDTICIPEPATLCLLGLGGLCLLRKRRA